MPKVPVSRRALMARVNRKLAADDQKLCVKRSDWAAHGSPTHTKGELYIVDVRRNTIEAEGCDLEKLAREVGALADHEKLVD